MAPCGVILVFWVVRRRKSTSCEAQCQQFADAEPETGLDDDHCSATIRHGVGECLHLGHGHLT